MENSVVEISKIPDEILSKIFSYLSPKYVLINIVDVCYRWKLIVETDLTFWNSMKFVVLCDCFIKASYFDTAKNDIKKLCDETNYEIVIGEEDLPKVWKMCSLKLKGDSVTTITEVFAIQVLNKISKICKNVEKFDCFNCFGATTNKFLKVLNETYGNLKEISFVTAVFWQIPYDEVSCFPKLTTIITHDVKFMRHNIYQLADHCVQLNSLWILFSRFVTNDDVIYFLEKKKETLQELGLGSGINDVVLEKISECKNLKVLFICESNFITRRGLAKLTKLPNLRYVSLHNLKILPQELLQWTVTSTVPSQLKILDLTNYMFSDALNITKITAEICPVTTSNDLQNAISQLEVNTKPRVHWMYRNVF